MKAIEDDILLRLAKAQAFVDRSYSEPLTLAAVAAEAALSPFHFLRLFRRHYGITPNRYLQQVRIDRAKDLLLTTDLSVTEICLEVGFSALGSFSRLFRRRVGIAPLRYREQFLADKATAVPFCFIAMKGPRPEGKK